LPTVGVYPDLISAQLAQSLLEAEGIDSVIPEENIAGIDWQWSTALQGIRLQVSDEDEESARELLRTHVAAAAEAPPTEETSEPCPHCGSELMGPGRWLRRAKVLTMSLPFLIFLWPIVIAMSPKFECLNCGRLWSGASD